MQAAAGIGQTASPENDARRLAVTLEKHRYLVLLLLTLLYAAGAILHARSKPLWFDEIVTFISASPADVSTAWKAAQQCDASPPLPHLLTHFSLLWFGVSEVTVRLPAILGFWIFCLCLFSFTRRLGIYYALTALLLPIATEAYSYAYEARAYGLELAFCGLALLSWQAAANGRRRGLACTGLALSLMGALLCHYYALLLYVPLAGAEAFRSYRRRRVDWPIWAALAVGVAPMVWRLAKIAGVVHGLGHGTWAPAYPEQIVEFWEIGLQHTLSFLVLATAVLAVWIVSHPKPLDSPGETPQLADHELVLGVLFLAIPTAAVAGGVFVTHMFTARYALLGITGVLILTPALAARFSGGRALPGFLLLCLVLMPLAFVTVEIPPKRNPFTEEKLLAKALEHGPVVVPDGQMFLQMWYYAPERLRPNLLFLADEAAALEYMGFDAIDDGLRALRPWASVQIRDYRDFAPPGGDFLVYQNSLKPGWVLSKVLAAGGSADVRQYTNYRQLFHVKQKQ